MYAKFMIVYFLTYISNVTDEDNKPKTIFTHPALEIHSLSKKNVFFLHRSNLGAVKLGPLDNLFK